MLPESILQFRSLPPSPNPAVPVETQLPAPDATNPPAEEPITIPEVKVAPTAGQQTARKEDGFNEYNLKDGKTKEDLALDARIAAGMNTIYMLEPFMLLLDYLFVYLSATADCLAFNWCN